MGIRLVKGTRTLSVATTVVLEGDRLVDVPEEDTVIDVSARPGYLDLPSERPPGEGSILTFKGTRGRTVLESVCC